MNKIIIFSVAGAIALSLSSSDITLWAFCISGAILLPIFIFQDNVDLFR